MKNISQHFCYVIPPHMTGNVAHCADDGIRRRAEETLVQMSALAEMRASLVSQPADSSFRKQRSVDDARKGIWLPGKLVMSEHKKRGRDVEVNEAYDGTGAMHDFLREEYGRNSIDDHGMRIVSTVHYGKHFDNAMWNGSQMIFGDGDGQLFNRFTAA